MPLSLDQLRQLLAERSEPARDRPVPQERIRVGIRWARARRAAATGLAAAAVIAGLVGGVAVVHQHSSGPAVAAGQRFPAVFTASDGASYRRVAVSSMAAAQRSVTLKLTVGKDPIDVMAACDSRGGPGAAAAGVRVDGAAGGVFGCSGTPQLIGLPVRLNRQADITFTKITASSARNVKTGWHFAIYEWQPPATPGPAPAVPQLPRRYTGNNTTTGNGTALIREIASRSGDWPRDRTATFTLAAHGRNLHISAACAGAIGDRLSVTMLVNGRPGSAQPCTSWTPGNQPPDTSILGAATGGRITLTFHIGPPSPYSAPAYAKRPASWTIAIYQEQP